MTNESTEDDDWSWIDEDSPDWVPPAIDTTRASVARMYDYFLGGKDHFAIDRAAAERLKLLVPETPDVARANRDYMIRTVTTMAAAGVDQFLDLGTGIPTSPNLHETARELRPEAAAVYVDNDPVVLAHNRALLARDPRVVTVQHDLRDPAAILDDPVVQGLLDFSRPVGLLMIAVIHFVELAAAPFILSRYVRDLPAGSRVAITAITREGVDPEIIRAAEQVYESTSAPLVYRTRAQFEQLFDGLELMPPGVEHLFRSERSHLMAGVAVK